MKPVKVMVLINLQKMNKKIYTGLTVTLDILFDKIPRFLKVPMAFLYWYQTL